MIHLLIRSTFIASSSRQWLQTGLDVQQHDSRAQNTRQQISTVALANGSNGCALVVQVTPDQWHTFDCTMPKAAATDEPNVEETTYHNISQHTAQTTSGTRSMEGEIQVMNNDNLHILIAPICTGLCKWLPSNNSSQKRMLKRSSLATCRAFCTLSQFAPAPQELEGKTLRLLPVCRFLGKNFAPQILTCAVYVLESFGCECCVNAVVGVLGS